MKDHGAAVEPEAKTGQPIDLGGFSVDRVGEFADARRRQEGGGDVGQVPSGDAQCDAGWGRLDPGDPESQGVGPPARRLPLPMRSNASASKNA
jgi:hypothetical protein